MTRDTIEAALAQVAKLLQNHIAITANLEKLERALVHKWAKEAGVTNVSFDRAKLSRLRRSYKQAVDADKTQFSFEGNEYLVAYARYLIMHLETVLEGK